MDGFRDPRVVLKEHGLWTKKHFGQNFLTAPHIPDRIAVAGAAGPNDVVFEIGAGCGTLTHALVRRAGKVIALEYDRDLVPILRAEMGSRADVREGNVLDIDWHTEAKAAGQPLTIYGNVPYHLSTDIVLGLLNARGSWRRATFLLQREFAARISKAPGEKGCSALSALTSLWTYPTLAFHVSSGCFHPQPKVESAVLVLEARTTPAEDVGDPVVFRGVVRALFAQRRKMARKSLQSFRPDAIALLERAGLAETRRGETFTLAELAALSRAATETG